MSADRAAALGVEPLAEIVASGMCAERFGYLHTVPAIALQAALKKASKQIDDLGLVEINEAFASVAVHANRMLGAGEEVVNVNGNSVALGHALGSTGARMAAASFTRCAAAKSPTAPPPCAAAVARATR